MSSFKVLLHNQVADSRAIITAVPEAVSKRMGTHNLIDPMIGNKLRVMGNDLTLLVEFTEDVALDAVAILYHNITASALVTVEVLDATDAVLATVDVEYGAVLLARFNDVPCRKIRVVVTGNTSDDGDVLLGRVMAGRLWSPQYGFAPGVQMPSPKKSRVSRALSGAPQAIKRPDKRGINLSFKWLSETEALTFLQLEIGFGYLFIFYDGWGTPLEGYSSGVYYLPGSANTTHNAKQLLTYGLKLEEF